MVKGKINNNTHAIESMEELGSNTENKFVIILYFFSSSLFFFLKLMILFSFGMFAFVTDKNMSMVRMMKVQDMGLI